ncbi:acyl-CoA dehydrogenase family protein [Blastococcus sp. URHD0036]|uniref:acyl-CoA dehydrogenase family protein n=1 Tax=Blastococcus sp. URHD0036 TaxID=1380356 RepID=UPI000690FB6E|nr:acyl-CoA dehydrogenase family protein [Blastococcus sp. URHD0036]
MVVDVSTTMRSLDFTGRALMVDVTCRLAIGQVTLGTFTFRTTVVAPVTSPVICVRRRIRSPTGSCTRHIAQTMDAGPELIYFRIQDSLVGSIEELLDMAADHHQADGDLAAFRARLRDWLAASGVPTQDTVGAAVRAVEETNAATIAAAKAYQAALYDAGFAGLTWPEEAGGRGLSPQYDVVAAQESAAYELPTAPLNVGLGMCGPTIRVHGTPEQRARYLPRLLRGEELWCQLFSEPDAGSDLAAIATRAERVEEGWRLTGQKVWTSGGRSADFGLALARSDGSVPKHEGLIMLIVDMRAPGLDVRPLRQMTGHSKFDEVFFDDVFVPDDQVIGRPGDGWRCARTTLSNERVSVGGSTALRGGNATMIAMEAQERGLANDPVWRQRIAEAWTGELVIQLMRERAKRAVLAGEAPGPEGALNKLASSQFIQLVSGLGVQLSGSSAVAWDPAEPDAEQWAARLLISPGLAIGGGTDEIVKNVIAERSLGLPREPSVGRGMSFHELRRLGARVMEAAPERSRPGADPSVVAVGAAGKAEA